MTRWWAPTLIGLLMVGCCCGDGTDPARPVTDAPTCSGPRDTWQECASRSSARRLHSFGATTAVTSDVFDGRGWLVRTELDRNSDGDVDHRTVYTRDADGRLIRIERDELTECCDSSDVYVRDERGRVVRHERRMGDDLMLTETWRYDAEGHTESGHVEGKEMYPETADYICQRDETGSPVRFGVDSTGDGRVDRLSHEGCDPPNVEPELASGSNW